jgi:hypothetical protein
LTTKSKGRGATAAEDNADDGGDNSDYHCIIATFYCGFLVNV